MASEEGGSGQGRKITWAKTLSQHPVGARLPVHLCRIGEGGIVLPATLHGKYKVEAVNEIADFPGDVFVCIAEAQGENWGYEIISGPHLPS
jgi:hypothetical protein